MIRKAENDKKRLVQLMRYKNPVGVVGVDSTANTESAVYGEVRAWAVSPAARSVALGNLRDREHLSQAQETEPPQTPGSLVAFLCPATCGEASLTWRDTPALRPLRVGWQVARSNIVKAEEAAAREHRRADYLAERHRYEKRIGFNPIEHSEAPDPMASAVKGAVTNQFQSKKRGELRPKGDTHDRIFGKDPFSINPLRTQHLYDQSDGGKDFNIVNHTVPSIWKPTFIGKERVQKSLAHPSQQALERGRCLQGYVEPSYRCTTPFLDPWH